MNNTFSVKTEVFEGPLDLLLELIEKRKLLINDISLASVTDEYMQSVSELQENNIKGTSEFVVVAATLLLIKSRSLLPVFELTHEEEENIHDLEARLKEYQLFKKAGASLQATFGNQTLYGKKFVREERPLFKLDKYTTISALHHAAMSVITELPKEVLKPRVKVTALVSLEEMITSLRNRIEQQLRVGFKEFTKNSSEKTTVIVGFLAVLEMVKEGSVFVNQQTSFGDIEIEKEAYSTPRYN